MGGIRVQRYGISDYQIISAGDISKKLINVTLLYTLDNVSSVRGVSRRVCSMFRFSDSMFPANTRS